MTAKQFLSQAYRIDSQIERRTEEIMRLRSRLEKATAQLTGMPRGGQSDWTELDVKLLEYEARLKAEASELIRIKGQIRDAIDAVEDKRYRELLKMRYIMGMRWERIAVELNYSYQHVMRMHGEALRFVRVPVKDETK